MQMQFPPLSHFSGNALLIVYHSWGINHIALVSGSLPCNLKTFKFYLYFSALHHWNLDVWFQLTMLILRSDWLSVQSVTKHYSTSHNDNYPAGEAAIVSNCSIPSVIYTSIPHSTPYNTPDLTPCCGSNYQYEVTHELLTLVLNVVLS